MSDRTPDTRDRPHVDIEHLIHHTELPHTRLSSVLDTIVRSIGNAVSWIWVVLLRSSSSTSRCAMPLAKAGSSSKSFNGTFTPWAF
jgi:hypothetical protein